ncbi:rab-interacting lysosomal protein-like isoform X1 [Salvelinus fontinalis]|uniref:rab-interacting lysosomal protein-like isoform X1 n=1 Tax=Salvelinus fontinalis TaxID=8038 RepID=UPI002485DD3A|nr:rab-interacting lysosomal protein-like isoform X1 [Salvelinus fontinalis]
MNTCAIMEKDCGRNDQKQDVKTEVCFERTCSALTVDDVYEIAKLIGSEVETLIDGYGKESATGLVPKIVKVLELLESFASRNHAHKSKEEDLLKAFETLNVQKQKKTRNVKECEQSKNEIQREVQEEVEKQKRRCEELQAQVLHLQMENQELQSCLRGNHVQEDRVQRQEREVMLKLKEVVDKQRDELRAKAQQIASVSKEVEALQEQLERFMKMNGELRHKQSIVTAQVKNAVERKADMEADLREKQKAIERLTTQLEKANAAAGTANPCKTEVDLTDKLVIDLKDPNRPCFTKQEVREMLTERNELKANLFLVQEELSYYQREILNDERCPGFLLDAVRSAIKKQKTVIKAKMLGMPEDECSSDEEKGPLFERRAETETETDSTDSKPQESRIRNLFGFLTRSGSNHSSRSPSENNAASSWEIIDDTDNTAETEPRQSP